MTGKPDPNGRPVRVLEVLGNAIVGGMENYVFNLARRLPELGFQLTCLCPFESRVTAELRRLGCEVHVLEMGDDPPWHSIEAAADLVREKEIDLLHGHLPRAHMLAALAGALTGRPAAATLHGMEVDQQDLSVHRAADTRLIAVCQHAYRQALELGVPRDHVALIRNGVDLQRFRPVGHGGEFRAAAGVPASAPLVGFVGRLSPEKGPGLFLAAAERVAHECPTAHFVLVGEGPLEQALREEAADRGLGDRVHFAGVWQEMASVFPALAVLVLTSEKEGTPLALLEGMACARPVVATSVGGVPELIRSGENGLLSPAGDAAGIARHIITLLADEGARRTLGAAARRRVECDYSLEHSLARTARFFKQAVNGGHASRKLGT